jgi:hypothetical protein
MKYKQAYEKHQLCQQIRLFEKIDEIVKPLVRLIFKKIPSYVLFKSFIVMLGVPCGIYKSSYSISNISQLNSPPPSFSFIPLLPFLK